MDFDFNPAAWPTTARSRDSKTVDQIFLKPIEGTEGGLHLSKTDYYNNCTLNSNLKDKNLRDNIKTFINWIIKDFYKSYYWKNSWKLVDLIFCNPVTQQTTSIIPNSLTEVIKLSRYIDSIRVWFLFLQK